MSLAQGNNTPTRPRIEPGSPDPEFDALTTRPVRPDTVEVVTECDRPGKLTCEFQIARLEALPTALIWPAFTETIVRLKIKQKGSTMRVKLQKGGEN